MERFIIENLFSQMELKYGRAWTIEHGRNDDRHIEHWLEELEPLSVNQINRALMHVGWHYPNYPPNVNQFKRLAVLGNLETPLEAFHNACLGNFTSDIARTAFSQCDSWRIKTAISKAEIEKEQRKFTKAYTKAAKRKLYLADGENLLSAGQDDDRRADPQTDRVRPGQNHKGST